MKDIKIKWDPIAIIQVSDICSRSPPINEQKRYQISTSLIHSPQNGFRDNAAAPNCFPMIFFYKKKNTSLGKGK